jgi:hypothetical protein
MPGNGLELLKAKYDFVPHETEEMGLKVGDIIQLLFKDESGWAKGRKENGEKGWFPFDYTEVIEGFNPRETLQRRESKSDVVNEEQEKVLIF